MFINGIAELTLFIFCTPRVSYKYMILDIVVILNLSPNLGKFPLPLFPGHLHPPFEICSAFVSQSNINPLCCRISILCVAQHLFPPFPRNQRTFLKKKNNKNISIQAIGLSLYEDLEIWKAARKSEEPMSIEPEVIKTQWLNFDSSETSLIGRNILIVDEVDDTRRTLAYAVRELTKDLEKESQKLREQGKEVPETKIGVFVLHNKLKEKREQLPEEIMQGRYFACKQMPDQWLVYPWDALDIEEHTEKSKDNTY
ncbi:hypothetical protein EDD21DRAFT_361677 [Dissophora ornata]|nr:hypothetical protein EDD21DRAFT_361677 [Dissophora ornata]